MRRKAKVDDNQRDIVSALRKAGASVAHSHMVAGGFPDIVVGYRGANFLLEIKDGSKPPSGQSLTSSQIDFHRDWRGSVVTVNSVDAALAVIGATS